MKRIISLIMSVLMIATMFCGFAVTSTAADVNYATATVEVVNNGDGTYEASFWAKSEAEYGFFKFALKFGYDDTKLEIVPAYDVDGITYDYDLTPALLWADEAFYYQKVSKTFPSVAGDTFWDEDPNCLYTNSPAVVLASATTGKYLHAFNFSEAYLDDIGYDYECFTFDSEKGLLLATATFKAIEGATGDANITVDVVQAGMANGATDGNATDEVANTTGDVVTISLGSAEPETPALPEGINSLVVDTDVSARTTENVPGLRFVSHADIDWTKVDVSEMGTAIVKTGTEPGVDTTLNIPARVDYQNGEFLQEYTKDDNNIYTFIPGVKEDKAQFSYSGVISNIGDATMVFDAYAYVIVDGVTYYSAECVSACYNDVLGAASNDPYID